MILFDAFAVNISYFIALMVRYYVHFEFKASAVQYIPMFRQFAPIYTLICLAVFYLMKMYHGMWKYAGLSELNRILIACVMTSIIYVIGTTLIFERMSPSYYLIGGIIQFVLVAGSRFGYRIWISISFTFLPFIVSNSMVGKSMLRVIWMLKCHIATTQ